MRLFKSWHGLVVAGAITLMAAPALANEPTSKEQEMEQRIAELEAQLENVMTQMQTNSTSQTTLESQIAELQTSMGDGGNGLAAYWNNGIRMDSADKNFKFKIGGRIMNDYAFFDSNSEADRVYGSNNFSSGTEMRRARLYVAGTIYGNVGFKAEYDFGGGDADFKDVYISLKSNCIGTITVGHHKEPFGLEQLTSSKYITFMERGLPGQLAPGRNTGISVANSMDAGGSTWHWRAGVFRDANSFGDDKGNMGASEWNATGRLSGQIWADEDEDAALQVGGSFSYRKASDQIVDSSFKKPLNDETARVRAAGAQHLAGRLVDTGSFLTDDDAMWWGADAAFVMGPLHAQAEYLLQDWDTQAGGNADVTAWSAQVGYFLTGETRNLSAAKANWDRTSPSENFDDEDGMGAWEIAARYDGADLTDGGLNGGEIDQWTIGLNWYLNPNTRVMFNYAKIYVDRLGGTDDEPKIDVLQMRFQIDF